MKLTDLKKQLNPMDQNELVALICKLYKGSKQAQSIPGGTFQWYIYLLRLKKRSGHIAESV